MNQFYPEGSLLDTPANQMSIRSASALYDAAAEKKVLEARVVLCDAQHNLHVEMPAMHGVIPYEEGAIGIAEGTTRDIALISRVGKPISFLVDRIETLDDGSRQAVLSRREAQVMCKEQYIHNFVPGDIIPARVTRLETFGAFCDIGCGLPALMPIASISVSRITHPSDRLKNGMLIRAVVSSLQNDRICLSQRELLGTWKENTDLFQQGETVAGIIRSVEEYGIFVELTPNLAGLAEPKPGVKVGQCASVFIKSIIPEKMKLKLVIIDTQDLETEPPYPRYFFEGDHMDHWLYSPPECEKKIETDFTATY